VIAKASQQKVAAQAAETLRVSEQKIAAEASQDSRDFEEATAANDVIFLRELVQGTSLLKADLLLKQSTLETDLSLPN
jgi:hypothetical protein